ncbi:MAG TPA: hypothetical protein VGZ89_02805 [Xanthobacteraceae bacterium]|jgi:hypothetical protein|nr:hypothetical protein [Xanthobacteraceae bacterium]
MYLLLLVFGGLLGAAGVVLAGSGMSLRDGTFDGAILTPGIVAAAGGLLLIGLGAGLRTLQRIERTLAARPMPRALAIAESAKAAESVDTSREPARIPFAPKASHESQPGVASRDILGDKSSEAASGSDKTSSPVPASALAAIHDANAETSGQRSGKSGNGAAGVPTGLRLSANLRRASAGERQSEPSLDALWPKGPRPSRAVEGAPAPIAQNTGVTPTQSQQSTDAPNAPAPSSNPVSAGGVAVLKSGVVNGMPYTLYSDGSIEAQLPEGMLRFGSITELRNHIEQSA